MPDTSGGIASGLYWIATGKLPLDDLKADDDLKTKPGNGNGAVDDPQWHPANKKKTS